MNNEAALSLVMKVPGHESPDTSHGASALPATIDTARERMLLLRRLSAQGAVAQLGERHNGIVEVRGSIPLCYTIVFLYAEP